MSRHIGGQGMTYPIATAVTLTLANTAYLLPTNVLGNRKNIVIMNNSTEIIYIGGVDVTTTTGLPLAASEKITIDLETNLYAVCGTAGADVRILESA